MNKRHDLLNDSIISGLVYLMIPLLLSGFFQEFYGITNGYVAGNYVSGNGLAIVGGSSSNLYGIFTGIIGGIVSGCLIVISKHYGASNYNQLYKDIKTAYVVTISIALLIVVFYEVLAKSLFEILNVPIDILIQTTNYFRIYCLGFIFYALFQLSINILRAFGESKLPSKMLVISYVVNALLDVVFVVFFNMNHIGMALSFICTQIIGTIVSVKEVVVSSNVLQSKEKIDFNDAKEILTIGIPSALSNVCFSLSNTLINRKINTFGTNVIAGYVAFSKLENIIWILLDGICISVTTLMAHNYGAKKYDRVNKSVLVSFLMGAGISIVCSIIMLVFKKPLMNIFTSNEESLEIAYKVMSINCLFYVIYEPIDVVSSLLKCVNKSRESTIIMFVTICLFRIVYISLVNGDFIKVILVYPLSWIISGSIYTAYYLANKKKLLKDV